MPRRSVTSFDTVREILRELPGTEESTSYGTPAFRVKGKLFARLREDGETLVVRAEHEQREALMAAHPRSFFFTDHYRDHPWVLARLPATPRALLAEVLLQAWRERAPKTLVKSFDAGAS